MSRRVLLLSLALLGLCVFDVTEAHRGGRRGRGRPHRRRGPLSVACELTEDDGTEIIVAEDSRCPLNCTVGPLNFTKTDRDEYKTAYFCDARNETSGLLKVMEHFACRIETAAGVERSPPEGEACPVGPLQDGDVQAWFPELRCGGGRGRRGRGGRRGGDRDREGQGEGEGEGQGEGQGEEAAEVESRPPRPSRWARIWRRWWS